MALLIDIPGLVGLKWCYSSIDLLFSSNETFNLCIKLI